MDGNLHMGERINDLMHLTSSSHDDIPVSDNVISVTTVSFAKQWSVSSPVAGFGFDVVWTTGSIWSFLADDESTCMMWVYSINELVKMFQTSSINNDKADALEPPTIHATEPYRQVNDSGRILEKLDNNKNSTRYDPRTSSLLSEQSISSQTDAATDPIGSFPVIRKDMESISSDDDISSKQVPESGTKSHLSSPNSSDVRSLLSQSDLTNEDAPYIAPPIPPIQTIRPSLPVGKSQQDELGLTNLQQSYLEASIRILQEQQHREISCLNEEMIAERNRYKNMIQQEIDNRDQAERKEREIRIEYERLLDQLAAMTIEKQDLEQRLFTTQSTHDREKKILVSTYETKISALANERNEVIEKSQLEIANRIRDMDQEHSIRSREYEMNVRAAISQQFESEKLREIGAIQRKCSQDIESIRNDEKKIAALEIERLKELFMAKQRETADDVIKLESMHQNRIKSLESQIINLKNDNSEMTNKIFSYQQENHKLVDELKRIASIHVEKCNNLQHQIASLSRELQSNQETSMSWKDNDIALKTKLDQLVNENSVLKAQVIEARRQVSEGGAAAYQWKKAIEEVEHSYTAHETALRIAREENEMLERELISSRDEKNTLRQEIERCHRLIYGQASVAQVSPSNPQRSASSGRKTSVSKFQNNLNGSAVINNPYTPSPETDTSFTSLRSRSAMDLNTSTLSSATAMSALTSPYIHKRAFLLASAPQTMSSAFPVHPNIYSGDTSSSANRTTRSQSPNIEKKQKGLKSAKKGATKTTFRVPLSESSFNTNHPHPRKAANLR